MMTAEYKSLSWPIVFGLAVSGDNERAMFAIECDVAQQVLRLLESHPNGTALRTRIQAVPFEDFPSPRLTNDLRFALWNTTQAAQWIGSRNATSHTSLLWQFALVRLSCYLNTGRWLATAAAETEVGL